MPFIDAILKHRSVAIVGLAKNVGKTECLNYILRRTRSEAKSMALTSIGLDGEKIDNVKGTDKPEITLTPGLTFVTSEAHFRQRRLTAEVLDVGTRRTSLGRLVTARAVTPGKSIISGPADTASLRALMAELQNLGIRTTLVDGALSRLSPASPAVTDALVLSTGAALSRNLDNVVALTRFTCRLIGLPTFDKPGLDLSDCGAGLWDITDGNPRELGISSSFLTDGMAAKLADVKTLYTPGAVTDRLLNLLARRPDADQITVVAADFTKMFLSPNVFATFARKGGCLMVTQRAPLLALCVNPVSPDGYRLDSQRLREKLTEATGLPAYDVKQIAV